MLYLFGFLSVIILVLGIGSLRFLRSQLQDDSVPVTDEFLGERVMFIFPHPDDEITCAGTIKMLTSQGYETILLTLTCGEAGPTNGLVDESDPIQKKVKLGQLRRQELQEVAQVLGINHLEILDFPDSGIKDIDPELLKTTLKEKISHYQPSVIVTYDDRIGFYGHPDHVLVARYLTEIFRQERDNPNFPVKKLYQVTLPKPMLNIAFKISEKFRNSYPTLAQEGLPQPTMAVKITPYGSYKREAMGLHRSQKPILDEMQPYFDKIAPFIYFRVFDKEYFTEVK
ncbi:LmbE family protein [Gloeothece citriformis PCC 7424]|uniref:LmbE family protein n=1 Tax=Gloeothece citriformis (strain PCC 7424) TaxID=65393 RepID=B7KJ86_GLOC7|nr:PIG-L family deacetylase [Gloeothece citriformis]ACK72170.1 LmbE family protein [Gloeothece citriformis PCC 7424]